LKAETVLDYSDSTEILLVHTHKPTL